MHLHVARASPGGCQLIKPFQETQPVITGIHALESELDFLFSLSVPVGWMCLSQNSHSFSGGTTIGKISNWILMLRLIFHLILNPNGTLQCAVSMILVNNDDMGEKPFSQISFA